MDAEGEDDEMLLMPWMPTPQAAAFGPPEQIHVAGFSKQVTVFSSKQRPLKLTIYGSDFR